MQAEATVEPIVKTKMLSFTGALLMEIFEQGAAKTIATEMAALLSETMVAAVCANAAAAQAKFFAPKAANALAVTTLQSKHRSLCSKWLQTS